MYRALDQRDQTRVILKCFSRSHPSLQDIAQFKREYSIASALNHPNIVRPLALIHHEAHWLMVMEDVQGRALSQQPRPDLASFYQIALQLCDALAVIHQTHIIHKDLNLANLIWNGQRLQVIDFGVASELGQEVPQIENPHVIEGTLAYMSPEQTGRMNRVVDYRSDFYSVGVCFYELLSGRTPFYASDALEMVHCHLARSPDWTILQSLPAQLLGIVH